MSSPQPTNRMIFRTRTFWGAALMGVGTMAALDEIVFHQLLQWHHFYDRASGDVGLVSDGLLHAAELVALGAGFFLLLDAQRRRQFAGPVAASGFLTGLGAFQLWDGTVDHKILRLHQIRYDVDLVPYDIAWNGAGLLLLAAGIVLGVRVQRRTTPPR
ncbi:MULTISPECIES: DUF2243 domain-containing protein [unclassified Microbacterium]|uniref:DUF2243 domain-containing protein n=1 Tax=unclassified Microbacterium TaxID=2609290 RepID=UPI000EA9485D|nr:MULTISPECIES: DUF2243 domain-containing protein [unclassified Microbacterium]MBT2484191.1 DUF2243 domain-containing protein [Microbacterium sp. ISL-108]RKN67127.1 DUF2243 domain-containing protein [Microbacterium sp. CGR2]